MLRIPTEEFVKRNNELRRLMGSHGLDLLLVYGDDFHNANIRYLTDYWPAFERVLLVISPAHNTVICGSPEGEYYKKDAARLGRVVSIKEFIVEGEEAPGVETMPLRDVIHDAYSGKVSPRVGLVGGSYIPASVYELILQSIGQERVEDFSFLLEGQSGLRAIKSENELKMIVKAYELSAMGMETALKTITAGISEQDVAAEVDYVLRKNGADGFSFDTMIASGGRSNTVVGRATHKIIAPNDLVMVSVGAKYQGYASAIGRPVYVGTPNKEMRDFLELGVRAADLAEEYLFPGSIASKVDIIAREYIAKQGFGEYHLYSVGHGLGMNEVEEPFCTPHTEYQLVKGNVISIDIGLFGNPELGGYRYEDGFFIGDDARVALSNCQRFTF